MDTQDFSISVVRRDLVTSILFEPSHIGHRRSLNGMSFTKRGMDTINKSLDYVVRYRHAHVGIEHLLLVFTETESDLAVARHADLADDCTIVREIVTNEIKTGDSDDSRNVPQTPAAKQVIIGSMRLAASLDHAGINPEHMFLALLNLDSEPLVKRIIDHDDIDINAVRERLTTASEIDSKIFRDIDH